MTELTRIIADAGRGDPKAAEQLLPLVYDELRKLAQRKLAEEAPDHTLQPTALVHEAYLRLVDGKRIRRWSDRLHFYSAAAEAMRRILVDHARRRDAQKRGGKHLHLQLEAQTIADPHSPIEILALHDALTELENHHPTAGLLVKLRYFGGLTHQDAAKALGITRRAADRLWTLARAWLFRRICE